jgi:nucleoside-diphosphate-sugar epimerase
VRLLVTGGAGFIGSHLVKRLVDEGHEVRILDNFSTGRRERLDSFNGSTELVEGDVQSFERAHRAVKGCEAVLHQAALPSVLRSIQDPLASDAVNVTGTLNILLAARDCDVRRVVFASSSSIYGRADVLPVTEDLACWPISPYAVGKFAAEAYCRSFHEIYGLETVALRYFNVFGPYQDPNSQYAAVIPRFVTAALAGEQPTIYGDGEQSRDFTPVDNVVEGNLLALQAPGVSGEVFNVACGERITLNRLVDDIGAVLGRDIAARRVEPRVGEVLHSQASIEKARTMLDYWPSTTFAEGLRSTIDFFRPQESSAAIA